MKYPLPQLQKILPPARQAQLHNLIAKAKNHIPTLTAKAKNHIPALTATTVLCLTILWLLLGSQQTVVIAGKNNNPDINENTPTTNAPIQTVRSFISQAENFQPTLKLTGQTTANRTLNVKSEISGRVEYIPVSVGDVVNADSLLLQFAEEDRRARLQKAETQARHARKEYEVVKELGEQGFKSDIAVLQAEAEQAAAVAELAAMQKEMRHTEIRAPYKAVITDKYAEVGDYLQQGQQALSLMEADPILLKVQISERNFYDVKVGQTVKVKLSSAIETAAIIRTVSPSADAQTRTFTLEAAIGNPDYRLPIGATASVEINLPPQKAHRVKSSHLSLNDQGIPGIKTLEGNLARFNEVTIVGDAGGILWVIGNFPDTITVIGEGQGFITDGQTVITTPQASDSIDWNG